MSLDKFIENNRKAISANFKIRNNKVASFKRMIQIKKQRRDTIKRYITQLRAATNPSTKEIVANLVAHSVG